MLKANRPHVIGRDCRDGKKRRSSLAKRTDSRSLAILELDQNEILPPNCQKRGSWVAVAAPKFPSGKLTSTFE